MRGRWVVRVTVLATEQARIEVYGRGTGAATDATIYVVFQ